MTLFIMNLNIFKSLANLFKENGFSLFMIGGTSRDYLLKLDVLDYDFVSDATPEDMKKFLPDANYHFEKYGSVRLKIEGVHVDITTFRSEGEYLDFRHPNSVKYVKTIEEDFVRRDFTINAIYIDEDMKCIDPSGGLIDLKNRVIRFIGDPIKRIKEDPLRILRAERFEEKLNFEIEEKSLEAINKYRYLLDKLNPEKVKEELRKLNHK